MEMAIIAVKLVSIIAPSDTILIIVIMASARSNLIWNHSKLYPGLKNYKPIKRAEENGVRDVYGHRALSPHNSLGNFRVIFVITHLRLLILGLSLHDT